MLNDLLEQLRRYDMIQPGDRVTCAVSGGADSMALLWGMYLLRDKLGIDLQAAHFNHQLRGAESDLEEAFVTDFCSRYEIPLALGRGKIVPGKKGLEAAAREARYAFFAALPGKVATAHTADDNAETVLMHLVRGTGLKGLGGIAPVRERYIRPMLGITRRQILAFLEEYSIPHTEDSSNQTDAFLRNRLRHRVMPLLTAENPSLAENVSRMAMGLRRDEEALQQAAEFPDLPAVTALRQLPSALRCRVLERFLKENGVKEPEMAHISLCESLIFSDNPSASACLPGKITVARQYDRLVISEKGGPLPLTALDMAGTMILPEFGLKITCAPAAELVNTEYIFTVCPRGKVYLRCRQSGDDITLPGGTKSLKKLFIDRKIPAFHRERIPVLCDDEGILAVGGLGADCTRRATQLPAVQICLEYT